MKTVVRKSKMKCHPSAFEAIEILTNHQMD